MQYSRRLTRPADCARLPVMTANEDQPQSSELSVEPKPTPLTADDLRLALYYVLDNPRQAGEADAALLDRWAEQVYARLARDGAVRVDPGTPPEWVRNRQ